VIPSTSELIKKYSLNAKKSLGQNFILDKNFTDKIARAAGDLTDSIVLEVGPGPSSLTCSILDAGAKKLIVIEKDSRCIAALSELKKFYGERLEIVEADAVGFFKHPPSFNHPPSPSRGRSRMRVDFMDDETPSLQNLMSRMRVDFMDNETPSLQLKIIANLPYNIGTILLFKWLEIINEARSTKHEARISSMHLMLQKEVVERIVAKPDEKHYGRLAVMVNFLCETRMLFEVNKSVFTPSPKVTSAIIEIIPREKPLFDVEFKKLERVVAAAFNQRRKMLRSALKPVFKNTEEILREEKINPELRAENLQIEEFCRLAKRL